MKSSAQSKSRGRKKKLKSSRRGFDIKSAYGVMLALVLEEVVAHFKEHALIKLKKRKLETGPVVGNAANRFDLATREGRRGLEAYCVSLAMGALANSQSTTAEAKKNVAAAGTVARMWQALQTI